MPSRRSLLACLVLVAPLSACQLFGPEPAPEIDMEAAMARMAELAQPGEHHEHLKQFEGKWTSTVTMWMEPGDEPMTLGGSAKLSMIMGGRFLRQSYVGEFMGESFEGESTMGYDNAMGRYFSTWMDSMGTFMLPLSFGHCSEGGKVITFHGTWYNPILEVEQTDRQILTLQDPDHFTFLSYTSYPGQEEYLSTKVEYTRR